MNRHLVYMKQVDGKNLMHGMTNLMASNVIDLNLELQPSFLNDRSKWNSSGSVLFIDLQSLK